MAAFFLPTASNLSLTNPLIAISTLLKAAFIATTYQAVARA